MNLFNKRYFKLSLISFAAIVAVIGISSTASAAISSGSLAGNAASDLLVATSNADYNVQFNTNTANTASTITVTFPAGYTITSGVIGTASTAICNSTSTCTANGAIQVNGVNRTVDNVSGSGQTVVVTLVNPVDMSTGVVQFRLLLGVQNATTSGTSGTFTITTNASGEAAQSGIAGVALTPAAASYLTVTGTSPAAAGANNELTITAKDVYGNTVSSGANNYTGAKDLMFSGPVVSPDGNTPQVESTNIGATTTITFTNGQATGGAATLVAYKAEVTTVDATDGSISSTGDSSYDLDLTVRHNNTVDSLRITAATSTPVAGATDELTITAKDAYGNTADGANGATAYNGVKSLTFSGLATSSSGSTSTIEGTDLGTAGNITFTSGVAGSGAATLVAYKAETASLDVTDGTASSTANTGWDLDLVVAPASADSLRITGTGNPVAGANDELTITAYDVYGNTVSSGSNNYTGAKSLMFSGPAAAPDGNTPTVEGTAVGATTTITFTNGVAGTDAATLVAYKAETVSLDVTDGTASSTGNTSYDLDLTVQNGVIDSLRIAAATTTPVVAATDELTITAKDLYGNTVNATNGGTNYDGVKSLTFSGLAVSPSGSTSTVEGTAVGTAGNITFTNGVAGSGAATLVAYKSETASLDVTDGTASSTANTGWDVDLTPQHAVADHLEFSSSITTPQTTGASFNLPVINAVDVYGNVANGNYGATAYTGAKTIVYDLSGTDNGPETGTDAYTTAVTFNAGVSTTTLATTLYRAQATTITASSTDLAGSVVASNSVTVQPAAADSLRITGTSPAVAGANNELTITAKDAYGNTVSSGDNNYTGAKVITFSGPVVSPDGNTPQVESTNIGATTTITFTNGQATGGAATLVAYKAEVTTVDATDGTASSTGDASWDLDLTVRHAATDHLKFSSAVTTPQTTGVAFNLPALNAVDLYGNVADGANGATAYAGAKTVAYVLSGTANGPETGTDAYTTAVTFTAGAADTALATTLYRAQSTNVLGNADDLAGTDATSTAFTVQSASGGSLRVTGTGTVVAGTDDEVTVTAYDAYGNVRSSGANNYTGSKSLVFSGPAASPDSNTPTVEGTAIGATTTVAFTNGASDSNAATLVAYKSESISLDVTDGTINSTGNNAHDLDLTVRHGSADSLRITGTATIVAGANSELTVTAKDAYGNTADGSLGATAYDGVKSLTFSGLAVSPSGSTSTVEGTAMGTAGNVTFTSGVASSGAATLVAYKSEVASLDVTDGTASSTASTTYDLDLTVRHAATSQYTVTTATTTPVSGTAFNLTVTAKDAYGNTANSDNGATPYTGTALITTSATPPYTLSPSMYPFVSGDAATKTFTNGVTLNTVENSISVTVRDFSDASITGSQTGINISSSDAVAPTVSSIYPANAATGVAITVQPYIEFSEALKTSSITTTTVQLRRSSDDVQIAASVALSNGDRRVILMPATSLANNTAYYVYATTGVQDANSNPLAAAYGATTTSQFTTIASSATISSVAVGSIAATTATITWSTDVSSTSNTVEYGTTSALGLTATTTTGDATTTHSSSLTGLTANTTYFYRVKSTAGGTTNYSDIITFTTAPTAVRVDSISATQSYATADGTYGNGWAWVFNITVPTAETALKMKFANWVSGSNTIAAASNMRYYSAQSSDVNSTSTAVTIATAGTYPDTAMTLNGDLDASKGGRQIQVTVEMKVPVSTSAGSYSTSYGVQTQ